MLDQLLEHLPTLIAFVLVAGAVWGIRKLNLKKELEDTIITLTKRVVDKAKDMSIAAMQPDSDGGAKITKAEASAIRQAVFDMLKAEARGPIGKLALSYGENWVKGKIGDALGKLGVKVDLTGEE